MPSNKNIVDGHGSFNEEGSDQEKRGTGYFVHRIPSPWGKEGIRRRKLEGGCHEDEILEEQLVVVEDKP